MNYENSKAGFKKLFLAEMIMIICDIIGAFVPQLWWLLIVAAVGMIVAFFMNLKGLKLLSKDEEGYMKAYTWALAGIIIEVVCMIVCVITKDANQKAYDIFNRLSKTGNQMSQFLIAYFVMKTSIDVCGKINKPELAEYIKKTLTLYNVTFAIAILLGLYENVTNTTALLIILVVAIIEAIAMIIAQIKYYIVLKKMADNL